MVDVKKILVTGGARSGKSGFAQNLAYRMSPEGRVLYIATAKVFDWEMEQRVKKHQESRPATWDTYEGYQNLADVIRQKSKVYDVILLDCVTVMQTNLLFDHIGEQDPDTLQKAQTEELDQMAKEEARRLIQGIRAADCHVIAVTNELGMGVVPERLLGRIFRDMAGRTNQTLAEGMSNVVFMVSGLPLYVKGGDLR